MNPPLTAALRSERPFIMSNPVANRTGSDPNGVLWALGRLAHQKDVQAWSVLVAQVGPDVHRLAMRMTGDYALAEDIVQETFLLVRDHADRFIVREGDGDDHARRWIMGVATNASLHIARRYRRELHRDARAGRAAAQTATPDSGPAQRAEDADQNRLLRRELAELPMVYGQALTLHYFAGQDYPELASHLRVSVNTVRSRVHRGLKALRERLDRCGVTLSIAGLTGLLSHLGAATTVGGAATVSASTLGLISSTAVPTTSFLVVSGGMTMATVLTSALAALLAVVVLSGAWFSSFRAESTSPQMAAAGAAAEVLNKARVTPFILVVKTDQLEEKNILLAEKRAEQDANRGLPAAKPFFTSDPNQFRLSLHPFARYDFTIDWGDGTKEVVRSGAAAGKAVIDKAWLEQVKKGLEQPVTVDFENIPYDFTGIGNTADQHCLSYLLEKAGIDLCPNVIVDPNLSANSANEGIVLPGPGNVSLRVEAMKLGDVFKLLTKLTGLTYVLHDRALLFARRKDIPSFVCPQHTYAKAGTYTVKITENVIGGFPQVYFNGGYDSVKVMDLAQWGSNAWTSLEGAFMGCVNMTMSASDSATAVTGAVKEFRDAWFDCRGLTSFPLLNTAAGTDFDGAWYGCSSLTSFPLLNTAAGRSFGAAWHDCSGLTSFPLLNTAAGTYFNGTWAGCSGLTSFPLLNTAAATYFGATWEGCSGLTSFPLLNTAAGTMFTRTWSECSGLTSFPLLNTAAATSFSVTWQGCSGLTSFPLLNTSAATHFGHAWSGCSGLTSFPLLNTAAATSFKYAWYECSGLTSFPLLNTYAGTDFSGAWRGCSGLTSFPELSTFSGTDFDSAWSGCSGLTSFPMLHTSGGKNFDHAWSGCRGLTSFPLLNFGKMEKAERCFSGVTLTSASYSELLANIAALNKTAKVTFDGGNSRTSDQNGIQAREKLIKELGWTMVDGDTARQVSPALLQPLSQEENEF